MSFSLQQKIKEIRSSIVAVGYSPGQNQINISGSGFCISDDGKILTSAHVYNQTPPQFQNKMMAMVMNKQDPNGLEHYIWLSIFFIKKDDQTDVALFQIENYQSTLLKKMELGDSEKVEVGEDTYFIGFPYAAQLIKDGMGITLVVNKAIVSNIKQDGVNPSHPRNFIIVDAISNPGNSGCPLIDIETNKVIGIMSVAFRIKSQVSEFEKLDIREPMHIAGARPINLAKSIL
ncbi:hypothetical protein A3A95_00130 [Candidatus Nomurabacteria bacterium RIFCSPLOWO2_01_FULL_39_18]|uniref:Serine protease n=1 Tax=Candidatus Nomurabacteria bacterium RIFCSPHIGHO2_01_FULL_40_20 TaxID=1801738 RepID=A0A1F6V2H9_9BACT|nr:MAG: hypothetical protein A2733_00770 [Candidatus Nomurabacteria bacterium RIFCSPHIGHO2_01_FULL_40_20]OGI89016.1 MAG: hypothetical protein A3A95_00130 [Candidatus Nomurabacteria bacterium RIFCSPLOWO2_01_FULL_39_18]